MEPISAIVTVAALLPALTSTMVRLPRRNQHPLRPLVGGQSPLIRFERSWGAD